MYETMRLPIQRYLLGMRFTREDAEELVQETFLRLYRHLEDGGDEENLHGWLYRVAHNLGGTSRKSVRSSREVAEEEWNYIQHAISDPHAGPEKQLLERERLARLHQGISTLSQLQRNCVLLRMQGFRYREIADILDVTSSTVAGSLRHVIERLTRSR